MTTRTEYDLVVVGAGFAGSVVAERAAQRLGWRVLVVEQRDHVGGNAADMIDANGVLVHRYGPHIFHTNSDAVWRYLGRFTKWLPYRHRVQASLGNTLVPLPFNLNSISRVFPLHRAREISEALVSEYGAGAEISILRLRDNPNHAIRRLSTLIYEQVYLGYTRKQWGLSPDELDPSVTARVPVRIGKNDEYFTDRFQGIPTDGYSALIERILAHDNINLMLGTDYHDISPTIRGRLLVYTGTIDRFFDFRFGELPYRTLRIDFKHTRGPLLQSVAVVTHPGHAEYTRSTEYRHFTGQSAGGTTLSYEYPGPHLPGETTPYYPIPVPESRNRYRKYRDIAKTISNDVTFCGRLGRYQYLNMDQAVAQALATVSRLART
ncbi:MAG: UDP-galactopyranose mutase [Gemmatimonadaceae bacterium]